MKRNPKIHFVLLVCLIFLCKGGKVSADCEVVTIIQGAAKIIITSAKPFKEKYWKVDFDIIQSLDSSVTEEEAGKQLEAKIFNKPFFKGSVKDVPIKCEDGVCELLKKVDFSTKDVHAITTLFVDCPDANYIDYIKIVSSQIPPMVELSSIPLMEVRDKEK